MDRMEKIASKMVSAAAIREGDVCVVDMRAAMSLMSGGMGSYHQSRILRDVVRQGDGKVDVDEVRGDDAMVSAHDNPGSKILGGVSVPVGALRKVASRTAAALKYRAASDVEEELLRMTRDVEAWVEEERGVANEDKARYDYAPYFRKLATALTAAQRAAGETRRMTE